MARFLSILLLILLTVCGANAATFWTDELESGNTGYTLPSGYASTPMTFDTAVKRSGSGSLRYNFGSECYPDSSAQTNCGGYTDRSFTATDTFYRRVYVMLSSGFTVSDVYTKMFRSDTNGIVSNWWVMGCCNWNLFRVSNQNVPTVGGTTEVASNYEIPRNRWVCLETQETLNTPGVANGISRAWADGVQILNKTDIKFRQTGDTFQFVSNRFYRQTGLGSIWFDSLAVGNTRILCDGAPPPPADTTAPTVPTAFTAVAASGTVVNLSWAAASDSATITIRRLTGTGVPSATLATVTSPTAVYSDTTVSPGQVYSYSINSSDAAGNPSAYTTAVTVSTPATYRQAVGVYDFNVSDTTALASPWLDGYTDNTNGAIVSNQFRGTVTNASSPKSVEQFSTTLNNDQYCKVTLATFTGSEDRRYGCFVRSSNPPVVGWYGCHARKTALNSVPRNAVIGSYHPGGVGDDNLANDFTVVWGDGDTLICEAQGSTLRLIRIPSGSTTETTLLTTTNSEFTSGKVGLTAWMATGGNLANATMDNFEAGNLIPNYTAPINTSAVTSVVTDVAGATLTFSGPSYKIRHWNDLTAVGVRVEIVGLNGASSYRHDIAWSPGITFTCYESQGLNGVWQTDIDQFSYICAGVTPAASDVTAPSAPTGFEVD